MYLLADLIFQLRVAGHLTKTFASHPVLCRLDETASHRLLGAQEGELRLEIILVEFLCALERMLGRFLEQGFLPFAAELASADYLQGKLVHVGRVEGRGAGFDSEGRLLLASSLGIVPVISGTVELL
jgi:biotin-(acetyl-CoA carboxylase) ligase